MDTMRFFPGDKAAGARSLLLISTSSSSLTYSSYSLTTASFKMTAHSSRFSAFFLHLLTPNVFRSSSTQSSHLNLGLPGFFFLLVFPETFSSPTFHHPFSQHGQLIPIVLLLWM
jgi:hypothetical protein